MSILKVKNKLTEKWEEVQAIKGEPGKDGINGKDGYTPIKGVDYFDGKDGVNGRDGRDGEKGDSYIITEADYNAIAQIVLNNLPSAEEADF